MRLIQRAGCEGGPCPKMSDDLDTDEIVVQGTAVTDPSYAAQIGPVPDHEGVVRIPRAILDQYIASQSA